MGEREERLSLHVDAPSPHPVAGLRVSRRAAVTRSSRLPGDVVRQPGPPRDGSKALVRASSFDVNKLLVILYL